MRPGWEPPLSNGLQGSNLVRGPWRSEDGGVEVRVDSGRVDGQMGYYIIVKRVGNVTWKRWRTSEAAAGSLFEKAVDRIVHGEELGTL